MAVQKVDALAYESAESWDNQWADLLGALWAGVWALQLVGAMVDVLALQLVGEKESLTVGTLVQK